MTQSIVGTWATSFTAWHPHGDGDLILPFQVANRFVAWTSEAQWNAATSNYFGDAASDDEKEERRILSIIGPAPVATLSCFKFRKDMTFSLWVRTNNIEGMDDRTFDGDYDIESYGAFDASGGTIRIKETDHTIHATLKYLIVSESELRFIIAFKDTKDDGAPVGAGTLHKLRG